MGDSFRPFATFLERFGFIPNLFRAQTLLPRLIEAEAGLARAVLLEERALSRRQKECLLLTVAAVNRNSYCVTAHCRMLQSLGVPERQIDGMLADRTRAGLPAKDVALLDFALRLNGHPTRIGPADFASLRDMGCTDEEILEAILVTGLTRFLCTLSVGLGVVPDFERREVPAPAPGAPPPPAPPGRAGPHLRSVPRQPEEFPPFAFLQESFGFVPNIFRAQTLRPDVLEAEAEAIRRILLTEDVLTRSRKEFILLVISAFNLNTYCVTVHVEMLRGIGVPEELSEQVAVDHRRADLSEADKALLDFALKLARLPAELGPADLDRLRAHGFTDPQILEAVVMTGLTNFLNTLQMGLGAVPDFDAPTWLNPPGGREHLKESGPQRPRRTEDPDVGLVERTRQGDRSGFEELVRRHAAGIHRLLVGVTGSVEDAEDAAQMAFLKAYRQIGSFRGEARFSTWLTRIALNEALARLRTRRAAHESLDAQGTHGDGEFRPRQIGAWSEDPESLYSRTELRQMVERALLEMPLIYRTAVILRDLQQLSTQEAADALGIEVPTLKTRLLRGRLMLREALAPHFLSGRGSRSRHG